MGGVRLADAVEKHNMFILNTDTNSKINENTQELTNIDLIIASHKIATEARVEESGENMGSDHQIINMTIRGEFATNRERRSKTRIYNNNKMDSGKLRLNLIKREGEIEQRNDGLQNNYNRVVKAIIESIKESVKPEGREEGRRTVSESEGKPGKKHKPAVWRDHDCSSKKKEWKQESRRFYRNPGTVTWDRMKEKEREFKEMIKNKREVAWLSFAKTINHRTNNREMWDKIRRLQRTFTVPASKIITVEERRAIEEEQIEKFAVCISMEESSERGEGEDEEMRGGFGREINDGFNSEVKREEIDRAINRANKKSAPGRDGIDYRIIQILPESYIKELEEIYNRVWEGEEMPSQWKEAEAIFLEKTGKKALRPISLTSNIGKIMERIVNERIKTWAESNKIMSVHQNGFREGRSTMDNLTILATVAKGAVTNGERMTAAFIDVKAAYDNVDYSIMLEKLKQAKCPTKIRNYVKQWLRNRKINIHKTYDEPVKRNLNKGLPQAAIISPILYNIYTRDIENQIIKPNTWMLQYADDITIFIKGTSLKENKANIENALQKIT